MEPVKSNLRLTSVIAAIPLGMAALFLAGNVSSGAFLRDLGLSAAQFPSQFEWTILGGFTTLFVYGFTPVLFFIVAIAVCTTAMVIAIQIIRWRRAKGARKARSERKASGLPERGNTVLDEVESFSDLARDAAVVGIAFIVAISPLILVSGKAGDSAADDFKKRAAAGASVVSEIYFKSATRDAIHGVLVACNDCQCAYWIQDHSVTFSMSDIDRVESKPVSRGVSR